MFNYRFLKNIAILWARHIPVTLRMIGLYCENISDPWEYGNISELPTYKNRLLPGTKHAIFTIFCHQNIIEHANN